MSRCNQCGFLGLRHIDSREICEVEGDIRNGGKVPSKPGTNVYLYTPIPICFVQAHQLYKEISGGGNQELFQGVLSTERTCDQQTPWIQGFSPREHLEMLDRKWLHEQQERRDVALREWQERQAERDHQWRVEQHERDRKWREAQAAKIAAQNEEDRLWREQQAEKAAQQESERDERDRKWRTQDRWSALFTLTVSAVVGVLGVVATLISVGKLPFPRIGDRAPPSAVSNTE